MREIILTQGKIAIVDDEDYAFINQWKWYCSTSGYAVRHQYVGTVNGKQKNIAILMHRLINKTPKGMDTDHIDHDRLNNRKSNLRSATVAQNQMNVKLVRGNSKFKGVTFHKRDHYWQASINIKGKRTYLGSFKSELDAAKAYNIKALELHGEFAFLNEVAA